MTSNGKEVDGTGGMEDLLHSLVNKADILLKEKQQYHNAVAKASMKLQQASAKWRKPGENHLEVRRERWGRKNRTDMRRYEAEKANKDRYILLGEHIAEVAKFGASGKKLLMEVRQHLIEMDLDLPDEAQPYGEALTRFIDEVLSGTFSEGLTMLAASGLEDIARAFQDSRA